MPPTKRKYTQDHSCSSQRIISPFASDLEDDMDAERINTIGNLLVDLGARTLDLRGYL